MSTCYFAAQTIKKLKRQASKKQHKLKEETIEFAPFVSDKIYVIYNGVDIEKIKKHKN